jgi:hypothetical protein
MARDLTIILEDRPGTLASMGEVLGKAEINMEAVCGIPSEGQGVVHLLVEDFSGAKRSLEDAGIKVTAERDVIVLNAENRPGALGEIAQRLANAGVNIDLIYVASDSRLIIGVDDMAKGRAAI